MFCGVEMNREIKKGLVFNGMKESEFGEIMAHLFEMIEENYDPAFDLEKLEYTNLILMKSSNDGTLTKVVKNMRQTAPKTACKKPPEETKKEMQKRVWLERAVAERWVV